MQLDFAHILVKGLSIEHGNLGRCGRSDQRAEVTGARLCTKFGRRLVEREDQVKRWKISLFEWDLQEGELRQGKVEGDNWIVLLVLVTVHFILLVYILMKASVNKIRRS